MKKLITDYVQEVLERILEKRGGGYGTLFIGFRRMTSESLMSTAVMKLRIPETFGKCLCS
jgi:hypothetical protein